MPVTTNERRGEMKLYHGGRGGMHKGQLILPPSVTGAKSTAEFGNHLCDRRRVYVTTSKAAAAMYAAAVSGGDVYEVEPVGELETDPDCSEEGLSFACQKARIIRRHRLSEVDRVLIRGVLMNGQREEA